MLSAFYPVPTSEQIKNESMYQRKIDTVALKIEKKLNSEIVML